MNNSKTTIPCALAKDLMPLYQENLLSDQSNELIEAHLKTCADCQKNFHNAQVDNIEKEHETLPLLKVSRKLKLKRRILATAIAMTVCFAAVMAFYAMTKIQYVPYEEGKIKVYKGEDGVFQLDYYGSASVSISSGTRYDKGRNYYVTLYDAKPSELLNTLSTFGSGDKNENVYYAYPGKEAVLMHGQGTEENIILLPRITTNYYMIIMLVVSVFLFFLLFFLRRNKKFKRWLTALIPLPLCYFLVSLLVRVLTGPSFGWEIQRECITILLAGGFAYIASLLWLWYFDRFNLQARS
ncbi:MAG: zf-HC2 domain-containing protein [Bacillota bacterium]|nr:zf-HC2 domain-containing protein [Bacillota bacterium]